MYMEKIRTNMITNSTQKTKHWATITPLRIGGKLSSSWRVDIPAPLVSTILLLTSVVICDKDIPYRITKSWCWSWNVRSDALIFTTRNHWFSISWLRETLYSGSTDRRHKLWNIVWTKRYNAYPCPAVMNRDVFVTYKDVYTLQKTR